MPTKCASRNRTVCSPGPAHRKSFRENLNLQKEVPLRSREAEGATRRPSIRRPRRTRAQKIEAASPEDPGPSPRTNSGCQYRAAAGLGRRTSAGSEGAETGSWGLPPARAPQGCELARAPGESGLHARPALLPGF